MAQQLPELDVVLDDGGHTMGQQLVSFQNLFLKVKEGGLYIVEDTHTSYWREFHGGLRKKGSFIEEAKNLVDSLYEGHLRNNEGIVINDFTRHIKGISFYDSIVVFEKQKRAGPFHIQKGTETIEPYQPTTELQKPSSFQKLKTRLLGNKETDTFKQNDRGKL